MADPSPALGPLDIPGLIRRVRRDRDLSQRDLAVLAGLSIGAVARLETGQISPRFEVLQRLLQLGGIHLVAVTDGGIEAVPMRADGARDRGSRRLPAHLDPLPQWAFTNPWRYCWQGWERRGSKVGWEQRETRDRRRERDGGRPGDHPDDAALRRPPPPPRPAARPAPEIPDCSCLMACERWCVRECDCQCEPIGLWGYATYADVPKEVPAHQQPSR